MKEPLAVESASALIDEKIKELGDWRGQTFAKVRAIREARPPRAMEQRLQRRRTSRGQIAKKWAAHPQAEQKGLGRPGI